LYVKRKKPPSEAGSFDHVETSKPDWKCARAGLVVLGNRPRIEDEDELGNEDESRL
jgi:hypothetical protein